MGLVKKADVIRMLDDVLTDVYEGYGYQHEKWVDEVKDMPTVDVIPKKDLSKAVNKIIKCSMGKWYVGRVDGKTEEVVLLEDVLRILTDLLNEEQRWNG